MDKGASPKKGVHAKEIKRNQSFKAVIIANIKDEQRIRVIILSKMQLFSRKVIPLEKRRASDL